MTSDGKGNGNGASGGPGFPGAGWEVIDDGDIIGTASARLLSTCPDRGERLAALSLLGLLLDHSDEDGRIRLPLDTLARELGVEPQRVVRLLRQLLAVEAVRTEGDAVVVVGSHLAGSLPASRFLANLVTVLERQPSVPASVSDGARPGAPGTVTDRPSPGPKRRLVAAVGIALVAMALATAPSGDPRTSLRSVAPPASSAATPPPPPLRPFAGPPAGERSGVVPAAPGPAEGRSPGVPADGATAAGDTDLAVPPSGGAGDPSNRGPRSTPPDQAPPRSGAPSVAGEPGGSRPPSIAPSPAPGATAPSDQHRPCPSGGPEAVVSTSEQPGVWPGSVLDLVDQRAVQVTGTVTNDSEGTITIDAIEVGIGQGLERVVAPAGPVPMTVEPGGAATWEASVLVVPASLLDAVADVRVVSWSWAEPDLVDCTT